MGFLTDIVERLRRDLEEHPLDDVALMARVSAMPPAKDLAAALTAAEPPALIAEVKRASPSAGVIAHEVNPSVLARGYQAGGAAAVSVLTEPRHFQGSLADLQAVRSSVSIPVLRKDFLIHPSQVIEARASGADAVLLIVAALNDPQLRALLEAARDVGLATLVETHSDEDLRRAIESGARIIGVNARDLETLGRGRGGRALAGRAGARRQDLGPGERDLDHERTSTPRSRPGRLPSWWARR